MNYEDPIRTEWLSFKIVYTPNGRNFYLFLLKLGIIEGLSYVNTKMASRYCFFTQK